MSDSGIPIEWEVISTYTRKQALEDGSLIDVTAYARMRGFKIPTAITASLWGYIGVSPELAELGYGVAERLNNVLYLLFMEIRKSLRDTDRIRYPVDFLVEPERTETVEVYALVGPDDDMRPCLTIGLPDAF